MKKAKLIIDGKEYDISLTNEQMSEVTRFKRKTGFERMTDGKCFWIVDSFGKLTEYVEALEGYEIKEYNIANYYSDRSLADWCNRFDTLNRRMRRWAAEYNSKPIDWQDTEQDKWYVGYNTVTNKLDINCTYKFCVVGIVYFDSYGIAVDACNEFGNEIKWLVENRPTWF